MTSKLFIIFAIAIIPASASAIYDNLGVSGTGTVSIGNLTSQDNDYANEFKTPIGGALTLEDVIVVVGKSTTASSITAELFSDGTGKPGTEIGVIATVANSGIPSTPGDVTFTPASTFTLSANTQYWIVLVGTSPGNGSYGLWQTAGSNTGDEVGEDHAFWTGSAYQTRTNSTFSADIPKMEVDATSAAPEPAGTALLGLGLVGLTFLRRRRA